MKVAIWDIHAIKKDDGIIHFEIIVQADVKNIAIINNYCKEFFKAKDLVIELSSVEYSIQHREVAVKEIISVIKEKCYYIIEKEGCN
jgi:hypothetical protein